MAKSRKKTVAQQVVGTAAMGLPAPVRSAASTKWGARLVVVAILGLLGTGVATVEWDGWRPRLKINRERAEEVTQEVRDRVDALAHQKPKVEENHIAAHIFGAGSGSGSSNEASIFTPPKDSGEKHIIGARIFNPGKK